MPLPSKQASVSTDFVSAGYRSYTFRCAKAYRGRWRHSWRQKSIKNYKLHNGDSVGIIIPDPVELDVKPQDIPVEIVYEDSELLVVNKPKGMVVHPAAGNPDGTLVNALLYHCQGRLSSINGVIRPGIVHRIDKIQAVC